METVKISEETYKQAFEKLSYGVNEAIRIIMTSLADCEDLFLEAIENYNDETIG